MSLPNIPLHEAKNRFSAVVEAAMRGEPQVVTRRGTPAVVVLSATEYERLQQLDRMNAPSFTELLLAIPQDGKRFERADLTPRDFSF